MQRFATANPSVSGFDFDEGQATAGAASAVILISDR